MIKKYWLPLGLVCALLAVFGLLRRERGSIGIPATPPPSAETMSHRPSTVPPPAPRKTEKKPGAAAGPATREHTPPAP
ncbi:MAG: hypothetical protein J6Y19_03570, partial [Kiritimatiellae bacterium]|nr:hypothetical protein [Kiritimatiellia bacterium]